MNPLFTIKNLTVKTPKRTILSIDNLVIKSHKTTAIIGPNGAGKSTLLKALLGLYPCDITFKNQPIKEALKQRHIAWVGQHGKFTMPLTVNEFIQLGLNKSDNTNTQNIEPLLRTFDLVDIKDQSILHLSGGEKQRANIIRAIIQKADAILFDEPCNHLDIRHQFCLMNYIKSHKNAFDSIVVLHDLNMAANFADEIILLDKGKIIAKGTADEVMTNDTLSAVYQCDIKKQNTENNKVYFDINY